MVRRSRKKEKRRKRNNLISGLVIIFLMLFSLLAFPLLSSSPSVGGSFEYNNVTFEERVFFDDQFFFQDIRKYCADINDVEVEFFFAPGTMSRVNNSYENLSGLNDADVVLFSSRLFDGEDFDEDYANLVFFDYLVLEFQKNTMMSVNKGLLDHGDFDVDDPIYTCEDASSQSPVIFLGNSSDLSIVEVEPFCFEVNGSGDGLLIISDYLIYTFYDIL